MHRVTRQSSLYTVMALSLLVAGCGTSGSEDPPPAGGTTPDISIADANLVEGDSGTSDLEFSVTLSAAASSDVSADYSTADGTAVAGQDYSSTSGTLTIAAGATTGTIVVPVIGDVDDETDETLTVSLSNPSANVSVQRALATGMISDDDPPPTLGIINATISEGNSGTSILSFQLSLSGSAASEVSVDYTTGDVTAVAGQDYTQVSGTKIIAAGDLTATIDVSITGDTDVEPDETFETILSNVSPSASLGDATALGTILNDDSISTPSGSALNDTGVTTCSDASNNGLTCNDTGTDQFPGQDAENGRDDSDNYDGDGYAGFVFTKLDSNGDPLIDQTVDYATSPWSCVQDEVTGLMWEVKTDDDGLRDKDWTYSWYNNTGINDGGSSGHIDGGKCAGTHGCDTQQFADAVNNLQLCGFDDWRSPTRHDLMSLMHFGASTAPYVDIRYFANNVTLAYWSASAGDPLSAAYLNFSEFGAGIAPRTEDLALRLVRGGE